MLGREFVLTGKMDPVYSKFYSILFTNRQSGDYEDFIQITQELVDECYPKAEEFIDVIEGLL